MGDLVFFRAFLDLCENVTGEEVHAGEVDGNRDDRYAFIEAGADALADLFQNVQVELVELACIFKSRDEFARL